MSRATGLLLAIAGLLLLIGVVTVALDGGADDDGDTTALPTQTEPTDDTSPDSSPTPVETTEPSPTPPPSPSPSPSPEPEPTETDGQVGAGGTDIGDGTDTDDGDGTGGADEGDGTDTDTDDGTGGADDADDDESGADDMPHTGGGAALAVLGTASMAAAAGLRRRR